MLYTIIIFSAGVFIGLRLNKQGTQINTKWVKFKLWLRNLVRDNVR